MLQNIPLSFVNHIYAHVFQVYFCLDYSFSVGLEYRKQANRITLATLREDGRNRRYTMTKSTSIIFILLFSIIFRLERRRFSLVFVVLLIAVGLFMFSYEAAQFDLIGFCLVLFASFLSGIRWTTAQLLSQKKEWVDQLVKQKGEVMWKWGGGASVQCMNLANQRGTRVILFHEEVSG
ncbi:unnamed protein product [Echinostoma caproni]|uniref:Solute carrier family 35 member C2 n=1 Tax=Echinostoma caproni TaxID=27848 RepID=A0A183AZK6_9TREM|nr:unnamed protein product [Echinostoma caproni]